MFQKFDVLKFKIFMKKSQNYFWYPLEEDFKELHGWLINILPTRIKVPNTDEEVSGINLFFLRSDGTTFRIQVIFESYFYVMEPFNSVANFFEHKKVKRIEKVRKEDIGTLEGFRDAFKFVFNNVENLISVRKEIRELNAELREYDVIYYERFCIDMNIRVGNWYIIENINGIPHLRLDESVAAPPQPRILAFDIECSKDQLKFPSADKDEIMMISYIADGTGYLEINRRWFSKDIETFEYSPMEEYYCEFNVFNYNNEKDMLNGFFNHILELKPHITVTFNGDFFDWPFVDKRAKINGINMYDKIGYYHDETNDIYISNYAPHIDCMHWVQRDSYLPAGSRGLKAVTKAKLQYNPLEINPEEICPMGVKDPQKLANYSVSDAYATYYLYMKYIHPFIFSLSTVIPLNADDCLRKGTGTLCESLLMARAFQANIFFPNKTPNEELKTMDGHILQSETYIGGRVEAIESGIFRDDIPSEFVLSPKRYQDIIDKVPSILDFVINIELGIKREDITNYEEVEKEIIDALTNLRDNPKRNESPVIIHLDVAAMYPNIILTNKLQPTAIVNEDFCSKCTMKSEKCQRRMTWLWRGEIYPSSEAENNSIRRQLETEMFEDKNWYALSLKDQAKIFKKRLSDYCKKHYNKTKEEKVKEVEAIICMKANSFYIETVKSFRDRRYEFKNLVKVWSKKKSTAKTLAEKEHVAKMIVLYESMQLAHKALLNSFYGYVMRTGARWKSMEMAGVVTLTGSKIIQQTREIMSGLGRPLELDTDGIWTTIPPSFPMNKDFVMADGSKRGFSFPCSMLNQNVDFGFSNYQYHDFDIETSSWKIHKENSIFFEVDGPYHAMFLPSAKEEGGQLKKRYAVFNKHGAIQELKGFEIKRRGEWQMIKMVQRDAFSAYMYGKNKQEVYDHVADVCRQYINILQTKGRTIQDEELLDIMCESSTMSKTLAEYGDRKSTAATTARRLVEILGESILETSSLKCEYIISKFPVGESIAGRAIPRIVFQASPENTINALQKWCGDHSINSPDFRKIIDWDYYTTRFYNQLQKILIIPSYVQGIKINNFNVPPPDWVIRRLKEEKLRKGQQQIMFSKGKMVRQTSIASKPKYKRNIEELSDYQKALIEIKKRWSSARSPLITQQISEKSFTDWRIIEVRPSSTPGVVSLFIQTNKGKIEKMEVESPRIFYINSTKESSDIFLEHLSGKVKVVKKKLPHSFHADVITQFTLSESEYIERKADFTSSFHTSGVHGVYETQVTHIFRVLCHIGSSAVAIKKKIKTINDIKMTKNVYLPEINFLDRVYVYTCFSQGKQGLLAYVHMKPGDTTAEANIFPFYSDDNKIIPKSAKSVQDAVLEKISIPNIGVRISNFVSEHCENIYIAASYLQSALLKILDRENAIVLLQTHLKLEQMITTLKVSALNQLPVITIDFKHSDNIFSTNFRWHDLALENFVTRFLQLNENLDNILGYSQLINSPVGNLHGDFCINALDLLFARQLMRSNYILWYSDSPDPDIGHAYSNSLLATPGDPHSIIGHNSHGTYLSRCVEFRIEHLSLAAIIESQSLFDKHLPLHNNPLREDFSVMPTTDALIVTRDVFQVYSSFIMNLIEKCKGEKNILTILCGHVGTWISSSSSVFYDPAIHSVYAFFLSIVFKDIISHFTSSQLHPVFADQSRLIINTGEFSPEKAVLSLKEKPLMSVISLGAYKVYDKLIWIDEYNFQGIITKEVTYTEKKWNLLDFLSDSPLMQEFIVDFFNDLLNYDGNLLSFFDLKKDDFFGIGEDWVREKTITKSNLRSQFDISGGDYILLINIIFYALHNIADSDTAQDKTIRAKVQSVRRNALKIVGSGLEFSDRTKFSDPSLHLVVPSVLCQNCLTVRNIDILRDQEILEDNWKCPYCDQPYDIRVFERWIFEDFSRKYQLYQTQDINTQIQTASNFFIDNECSLSINKDSFINYIKTIRHAANIHGLDNLSEVINSYLEGFD